MSKFFWLVPVVALAFAAPVFAEDAPKKEKAAKAEKAPKAAAKLELAGDAKIDLAEIKAGESKDVEIKIKNTGDAEAKAVACTGAGITWDKEKPTIDKGAEGTVKGKIAAPKKAPKKEIAKTIKVTCGKGKAALKVEVSYKVPAAEAPAAK
jgi:uncharacterized membrane protein